MSFSLKPCGNILPAKSYTQLAWVLVALAVIAIYLPLVLHGGIITDDWGDIFESINCNTFWQCYADWFPLFSNRPLAPLPITLTTRLFGTNYSLYLISNSAIYLLAILVAGRAISPFINFSSKAIFIILAAVPCIAMPVIVSPINQLTATVAFLCWAFSLKLLIAQSPSGGRLRYFFAYFWLLCGFLTYEIILPLLFFTAFLPVMSISTLELNAWRKYFIKYVAPIVIILVLVIFWQKILAPNFMEVYSRLNFNPANFSRNLFTWIHLFIAQLPNLFIKAILQVSYETIFISLLVAAIFWISTGKMKHHALIKNPKISQISFFLISTCALLSSSLIFILTDESAVSWGYQARGLSSTWFALAIWIASISNLSDMLPKILRAICLILILIFTCLSILSFVIQRDKYIESWSLQMLILKDIDGLLLEKNIGENPSIIFDVPRYVPKNYNRELVFSQSWDLPAAITITTNHRIQSGVVIDSYTSNLNGLRIENDQALVSDGGKVNFSNLWLYEFNPKSQQGSLTPLKNQLALEKQLIKWGAL